MSIMRIIQTKAAQWLLSLPVCRLLRTLGCISTANAQAARSDAARDKSIPQLPYESRNIGDFGQVNEFAEYAAMYAINKGVLNVSDLSR